MVFSQSYLKLHRIIFLNSLIPIILILISLNPYEILFFRTLSAVVLLQAWFMLKKIKFAAERKSKIKLAASGILVFCFWGLSFLCVKASTASVYLVSLSTTPLWVSLIQYFENTRQHRPFQFLTSLNAVMGIYIIFNSDFEYGLGMALGISAAFFGAMLTVVSSYFSKNYPAIFVTYYQMSGSFASCLIFLPIYIYILDAPFDFAPSAKDMGLIVFLAFTFSIYAYTVFIEVMQKIPPFVVALVSNLSPIYGILTALLFFGKDEKMNTGFYIGGVLILASVFAYPALVNYMKSYTAKQKSQPEKL